MRLSSRNSAFSALGHAEPHGNQSLDPDQAFLSRRPAASLPTHLRGFAAQTEQIDNCVLQGETE
jgi:hypothetical protein